MSHLSHLELFSSATKYMYFNLDRKLFQSLIYRDKIIELFQTYWFNPTRLTTISIKDLNDFYNLNKIIKDIKIDEILFNRLFHYPLKRTGNAEVLLYLIIDNSILCSNNSAGSDITVNGINYEIKNCIVSNKYKNEKTYFSNFKLGHSFCVRSVINNIENYFGKIPKGSEINTARNNEDFLKIEEEYREIVYNEYFSKNNMIFIDKNGYIHFVGKVNKEQIFIDTITEGTIKPMIIYNKEVKK